MHPVLLKQSYEQFYKEAKAMQSLRHPGILPLYGVTKDPSCSIALVMEQQWKTLSELITVYQSLNVFVRLSLLRDVAGALSYLHGKGIIHRDLTPNNILVTELCRAKLSDFGQATKFREHEKMSTCPGNCVYMAPEVLKSNQTYTYKLDVFSFGCVFIFTVTGLVPVADEEFTPMSDNKFRKLSEAERRKDFISKLKSLAQKNVVHACIEDDPADRPNSADLYHQVEKCMKELNSLLVAKVLEKSKLDRLQAYLKFAIVISRLNKEKNNLKQCNLNLLTELEDAKNHSAEKDQKIAQLMDEIKVLNEVYTRAMNESKHSPNESKHSPDASEQNSDYELNSKDGSENFEMASDQDRNDDMDNQSDTEDDDDTGSFVSAVTDLNELNDDLDDINNDEAFPIQVSRDSDKAEVFSVSNRSDVPSMPNESAKDDAKSVMEVVYRLHPDMVTYMNIQLLIRYLNKYGVLTRAERYHLNSSSKSPDEKVDYLLTCLDGKDDDTIQNFIKALKEADDHTGHKKLFELLKVHGIKI